MATEILETTCCVVGGGPAGVMLGYLLARQGVSVKVLEKHADFYRDFRGDTVHPSTLEVLAELGLLEEFLKLPHQQVTAVGIRIGDSVFEVADFKHVPARCKFVALMPQWDFLDFLASRAKALPTFELLMQHEVTGLLTETGRVTGVTAKSAGLTVHVTADLVVGCDGRHSITRSAAGMELIDHGVPIDVLWFRLSRQAGDPAQVLGNVNYGKAMILIDRGDYFQAGLIIEKGTFAKVKARWLESLRTDIGQLAPWLGDRVEELKDWDQIKILTVQINRLKKWFQPGLLCIGDAAHAMSPAGGVGINLAIQDAVAAANILARPLAEGWPLEGPVGAVQRRREFPARVTQAVQLVAHRRLAGVFANPTQIQAPWQLKAVVGIPGVKRALGYAVGIGARPEHVRDAKTKEKKDGLIKTVMYAGIGMAATAFSAICVAGCERVSKGAHGRRTAAAV